MILIFKKLFKKLKRIRRGFAKRNRYIYYKDTNPMWNNGTVYVYYGKKIAQWVSVEEDQNPYDIIEKCQRKFKTKRLKTKIVNWR